jgi:hypothetical protein
MSGPTPELRALARRLVALETGAAGETADITDAVAATCERLYAQLERLIAPAGFHALLRRALHLAGAEFVWLREVRVEEGRGCSLTGLREAVRGEAVREAGEALVAVIANVLWLLVTFIGDDLTERLVRQAWPALHDDGPVTAKDEGYE